jgi:hypothetical protein
MSIIISLPFEGKEIMATVCETDQRYRSIYRVIFSNEYENVFYKDVENGRWIEEDLGYTEMASLVGSRIKGRLEGPIHVPKLLNWHSELWNGKQVRFGFTCTLQNDQRLFEIYNSQKKYLYSLLESESEGWEIMGNELLRGNIDPFFLEMVLGFLSEYSTDNA